MKSRMWFLSALTVGVALSHASMAQTAAAPTGAGAVAAQAGTHFVTLGTTAGPLPRKDRAQASNLLIVNGTTYLIDAGDGVARRIVQAGANFRTIDTIFITHNHSDHTAGLATLLDVQWEYAKRTPTQVYGPPGTERLVKAGLEYFAVNAEIRSTEGKTNPLSKMAVGHDVGTGQIYKDGNITVTAAENTHFNIPEGSPYHGKHKSYSYRFQTPDQAIVFTGDTGPSEAVTELAKGADVLVSEVLSAEEIKQRRIKAGDWQKMSAEEQRLFMKHLTDEHVTPEQVGKMASKAGVKMVVLTHLAFSGKDDDDYQRYVEEVGKVYKGKVVVAKDLMRF
jgi:ribonuclease BN (tRNA processing enzyme)